MGIEKYKEVFDRIHKYGITVLGALIYGLHSDSEQDLYDRTKFAIDSGMDDYLSKPIELEALNDLLIDHFEERIVEDLG